MMMKSEVKQHLEVPAAAQHLKLVRSKSLNYTSRTTSYGNYSNNYYAATMNLRPKRTFSLPNRENTTLLTPVVHIQATEQERVDEESRSSSDKESELNYNGAKNETSNNQNDFIVEPLLGLIISVIFLIWSWILDAYEYRKTT